MSEPHFRAELGSDGVLIALWDMPGRSMNVIDEAALGELEALVERVAAEEGVKGCVIASGKETFSGGADLTMLEGLLMRYRQAEAAEGPEAAARALFAEAGRLSALYRRMETCGKPFVAAINGTCLGGAFELALGAHARVAADGKGRMGLPEVKVGLVPGAGGTQRLPRMMPAGDALQLMLTGQEIDVNRASAARLVDKVVPAADLIETAREMIRSGAAGPVRPWDGEGFKLPGGPVYSPQGRMVFPPAAALYRKETHDNYPAARAVLQCVYEGLLVDIDTGLRIEARRFAAILRSPEAAAMIRTLFVSMQALGRLARRPASVPSRPPARVGVLGAGMMGAGIAYASAGAGIEVVLLDRDAAAAEAGKARVHALMSERVNKGRASAAEREALMERIAPGADYSALAGCDLVIEAVFEDREVKAEATRRAGEHLGAEAVFASNTSTLPISGLAEAFPDPSRFVGVHFFSPVERMMLVEVIRGSATSEATLAAALDYVRALRKTPIVVEDARGFFTSRVVSTYIREGHAMLEEGVPPAMVENAGRMAGMPVGPLALNDEVALDLAHRIMLAARKDLGAAYEPAPGERLLEAMVVERGRLGRKNAKGFYDYRDTGGKRLWPGLAELLPAPLDPDGIDVGGLKTRFLAAQALETARVVEEGIVTDMREADVGAILGFGYAPFTGGPLSYIDAMGAEAFACLCERLEEAHGPRFRPNALLRDMAAKGETFYGRFPPPASAA